MSPSKRSLPRSGFQGSRINACLPESNIPFPQLSQSQIIYLNYLPTGFGKVTSPAQQQTTDFKRAVKTVYMLNIQNFTCKSLPVVSNPGIREREERHIFQFVDQILEITEIQALPSVFDSLTWLLCQFNEVSTEIFMQYRQYLLLILPIRMPAEKTEKVAFPGVFRTHKFGREKKMLTDKTRFRFP